MFFLFIASAFFTCAYCQVRDPTKVCFPDVYQYNIYSLEYNVVKVTAFDYTKKILAYRYSDGTREVNDWAGLTTATINDTAGTCEKQIIKDLSITVNPQCLLANATLLTSDTTFLGLNPGGLEIEAWEYTIGSSINRETIRIGVTKTSPAIPVVLQYISSDFGSDVGIFYNPTTSIDEPSIFTVPSDCPIRTSVG